MRLKLAVEVPSRSPSTSANSRIAYPRAGMASTVCARVVTVSAYPIGRAYFRLPQICLGEAIGLILGHMTTGAAASSAASTNRIKVSRWLEPTVLSGDRLLVGDLTLDLPGRRVSGRGQFDRELTRNEFVVLATLIKDAGRVVSRQDLLEALGSPGEPAVVDMYIKYLRGLLLDVHSGVTIERSGGGYFLRP